MFYQGIDKVSLVAEKPSAEDEHEGDEGDEADANPEGAEGGDAPIETAEDRQAKDDNEQDDNGIGGGEKPEMTDEELAAR